MKENQLKRILSILVLYILMVVSFQSCKDDKEEPTADIVGSWQCSNRYYGGTDTFTFYKDGKMKWTYSGSWTFDDCYGAYTFNGSILTVSKKYGSSSVYVIVGLSSSSFVLIDEDGDSYTYYRK